MGRLWLRPRFEDWREDAVKQVRFAPDRKAIAEELTAHYEDHRDALLDCGYSQEEAEQKALEAMGDAREVGRGLNRVHKFYLGALWLFAKWLAIVLAVVLNVNFWSSWINDSWTHTPLVARTVSQLQYEEPPVWAETVAVPGGRLYLIPSEEVTVEAQTGKPVYHATLWLEAERPIPRATWFSSLELWDQEGQLPRDRQADNLSPAEQRWGWIGYPSMEPAWTRQQFDVCLVMDHRPEFLEIRQRHGTEPWTLRCEWEVHP